jgi:polysaccharide export outer membrane protein
MGWWLCGLAGVLALSIGGCASSHPVPATVTVSDTGGVPGAAATPIPVTQLIHAGDVMSISFFEKVEHNPVDYQFQPGDGVQVIFSYQTPEIQNLIIRPDGKVSLPVVGDVVAAGITSSQFSERLAKIFGLAENKVSVIALSTNSQVKEFLATLTAYQNRSGLQVSVRADGLISLPLIGSMQVTGMTVEQLHDQLYENYSKLFPSLDVNVEISSSPYRRIAVLGEVNKPGVFPDNNTPVNLMEALALAGGLLDDANKKQILLFKRVPKGYEVYSVDLLDQVDHPSTFLSYYMGPEDMVFVPKAHIERLDQYVNQYLVRLLPFSSTSGAIGYTFPP